MVCGSGEVYAASGKSTENCTSLRPPLAARAESVPFTVPRGVPPSELLFNHTVKGKLPILHKRNVVNKHKQARENDTLKQQYNKQYADNSDISTSTMQ